MMKKLWVIAFLVSALFLGSCENSKKAPNAKDKNNEVSKETQNTPAQRLVKVKSENSFDETYSRLKKAIEGKKPLSIIAELDHSANAKKADLELRNTKIIMFGNPKLGTPLMSANQEIGIDLPQKMLVYEDKEGDVYLVYNNPEVLAKSHKIEEQDKIVSKISGALAGLAKAASAK